MFENLIACPHCKRHISVCADDRMPCLTKLDALDELILRRFGPSKAPLRPDGGTTRDYLDAVAGSGIHRLFLLANTCCDFETFYDAVEDGIRHAR